MNQGLRFAMITTFYPPYNFGGDGHAIRRLAHALARRGHSVDVIHDVDAYRMLGTGKDPAPLDEPQGVRIHGLRSRLGRLSCLATQQLGWPLVHGRTIRKILAEGFDVIHYHNISLVGGPGILSYGKGVKLYTAHEHWLVCPTHVLWRHNREVCTSKECLRCVLHHRRPPQLWRMTSLLERQSRNVDAFLSLSEFSAAKHAEFGFRLPMIQMPAFLPESGRTHECPKPAAEPRYYLFVGRLERIKGLQEVIPRFIGEGSTELWIAGSGDYESELRRLAGDAKRIRFLGQQNADELRQLYRRAIAVVLPSLCYEVFPMVVLEAFQEGTPIIARNLGPFPEIVARSRAGLLFKTDAELAAALASLAEDQSRRDALGEAGSRAFKEYWHESTALDSYLRVIREIADRRGLRRPSPVSVSGRS
jgi:glycosyltransferase involved in cell wall biosynthesis